MISPERLAEIGDRVKAMSTNRNSAVNRDSRKYQAYCADAVPDLLQHIREQEEKIRELAAQIDEMEKWIAESNQ